jgi:hypothetical protein
MFKYLFIENCVVYEMMWKYVAIRDTEHDYIIQRMRFSCCYIRLCTRSLIIIYCLSTPTVFTQQDHHIMALRTLTASFALVFANSAVDLH